MKSRYTLSHSRRVTARAEAAGSVAGLTEEECALLRRAAAVHDIGRVAIATGTWDKRSALNALEWQRIRSHSHHTEAVLRAAGLAELAEIAGATHERGRGAGYHTGVSLDGVPFLSKIVAAADMMAALGELRPHRPALDESRAAKELRSLVEAGSLDARAVQCVLEAPGISGNRKSAWPEGLSDREVEVVRLVAIGRTNKEIGALLGMSPRTAQKHVMNVHDKLGLESRAGLALYALEHGYWTTRRTERVFVRQVAHRSRMRKPASSAAKEVVMPKYVIERTLPGAGKLSDHSYVTFDKIYCVYNAKNPDIVREHARCGGFPVDSVSEVKTIIDPTTAESR